MPTSLAEFRQDTKRITVTIGAHQLTVTYRQHAYTPEIEEAFATARELQRQSHALFWLARELIVEWDLLDDDRRPLPLDPEHLRKVPLDIFEAIFAAIRQDTIPNEGSVAN